MTSMFKNEKRIKEIGGKTQDDYLRFRNIVVSLNENTIPLYLRMGFNKEDQTDMVINAIMEGQKGAKDLFLEYWKNKIKDGQIPLEKILPATTIEKLAEQENSKEERSVIVDREIHRNLSSRFKKIYLDYMKDHRPLSNSFDKLPLIHFRNSIELTDSGLNIDVQKYLDLYASFMEACECEAKQQHIEAAEAINRFFNGAVEITQKEIKKYFIIEDGLVKPNQQSIDRKAYMRLGYRVKRNEK